MKGIGVLRWMAIAAMTASVSPPVWADTTVFVDATRVTGAAATHVDMQSTVPPGVNVSVLPYPAQTWPLSGPTAHTAGYSTQVGADQLCQTLPDQLGRITVFGLSLGSMTIDRFLASLPSDVPAPERLSFVVMGDPFRGGILAGVASGTFIPILEMVKPDIINTPYDVVVIQNQYDAIGDFPDRPWNIVAIFNAILGGIFYHNANAYSEAVTRVQSGALAPVSVDVNPLGGTTTTYVVPRPLAITTVLRLLGAPDSFTDAVDGALKPVVDAGYSRNDEPSAAPDMAIPAAAEQTAEPAGLHIEEHTNTAQSPQLGSRNLRDLRGAPRRDQGAPTTEAVDRLAHDNPVPGNAIRARHRPAA